MGKIGQLQRWPTMCGENADLTVASDGVRECKIRGTWGGAHGEGHTGRGTWGRAHEEGHMGKGA